MAEPVLELIPPDVHVAHVFGTHRICRTECKAFRLGPDTINSYKSFEGNRATVSLDRGPEHQASKFVNVDVNS